MIVVVVLEGVVLALLAVLVVGLLRTHAEILRRLHDLGAGVYEDGAPAGSTPGPAPVALRTQPGVAEPRTVDTPAFDVAGTTPDGGGVVVGVIDRPHTTLLAFLSSGCTTCRGFWDAFAEGAGNDLPGLDTHLVVVTKGPQSESMAKVAELARDRVRTVMSTEAWADYQVPVSPYFVLADGRTGQVLGEGSGTTWPQVSGLLEQACADAGLDRAASRPRGGLGPNGPARELRADEELTRAGIGPGHPSLYGRDGDDAAATDPPPLDEAEGHAPMTRLSAHGLSAEVGGGWDGEIYLRTPEPAAPSSSPGKASTQGGGALAGTAPVQYPVLQLANFALPQTRGDFGGGAVEQMSAHNLFVSLFEYGPESVGTALFSTSGSPWPVAADTFGTNRLQRPLPGQGGAQWFFTEAGRPFCLYVVLGSYLLRRASIRPLNRVLASITIT